MPFPRPSERFEKSIGLLERDAISVVPNPDNRELGQVAALEVDAHSRGVRVIGIPDKFGQGDDWLSSRKPLDVIVLDLDFNFLHRSLCWF
jgi:hypothetical protein